MAVRELIIFKHDSELGNAPSHKLFDAVNVERMNKEAQSRSYKDYKVWIEEQMIPEGVTCIRRN